MFGIYDSRIQVLSTINDEVRVAFPRVERSYAVCMRGFRSAVDDDGKKKLNFSTRAIGCQRSVHLIVCPLRVIYGHR